MRGYPGSAGAELLKAPASFTTGSLPPAGTSGCRAAVLSTVRDLSRLTLVLRSKEAEGLQRKGMTNSPVLLFVKDRSNGRAIVVFEGRVARTMSKNADLVLW